MEIDEGRRYQGSIGGASAEIAPRRCRFLQRPRIYLDRSLGCVSGCPVYHIAAPRLKACRSVGPPFVAHGVLVLVLNVNREGHCSRCTRNPTNTQCCVYRKDKGIGFQHQKTAKVDSPLFFLCHGFPPRRESAERVGGTAIGGKYPRPALRKSDKNSVLFKPIALYWAVFQCNKQPPPPINHFDSSTTLP